MTTLGSRPAACQTNNTAAAPGWCRSTLAGGLVGSLLLWLALPPCGLWPLAWVAPIPWLLLVRNEDLPGRRPYRALWLAGFVFWLLAVHWLRLPHQATALGWIALASYLACYLPVFVALTRVAVHQARVPLIVAAPIVWTGLELARAHLVTGFLMAALSHTQVGWVRLIQISDLAGGYAVSFVIMLVAACLARMWPCGDEHRSYWPRCYWPLVPAAVVLAVVLGYGTWRTTGGGKSPDASARRVVHVALIQGSIDADWKADAEKTARIFKEHLDLSREAVRTAPAPLDLIVWPETMMPHPLFVLADDFRASAGRESLVEEITSMTPRLVAQIVEELGVPLLFGVETRRHRTEDQRERFNSAVLADRTGGIVGRYDKRHLVMFGEYVPLAGWFPVLYRLTPLGGGLTAGRRAESLEVGGVRYAPNICFESVLPHLVARQLRELADRGEAPDVLVNLTNDAWFWGSSELDMHLACGVFRAVEFRKPFLVAANSGLSAWIDGDGRIRAEGPRRQTAVVHAAVELDGRRSFYLTVGDWPAGLCLALCLAWAALGARRRWREKAGKAAAQPGMQEGRSPN